MLPRPQLVHHLPALSWHGLELAWPSLGAAALLPPMSVRPIQAPARWAQVRRARQASKEVQASSGQRLVDLLGHILLRPVCLDVHHLVLVKGNHLRAGRQAGRAAGGQAGKGPGFIGEKKGIGSWRLLALWLLELLHWRSTAWDGTA